MPVDNILERVLAGQDWRQFGGGAASFICRFFLRDMGKGGSATYVQSKEVTGGNERDYAFYARGNMCSAEGFIAALKFCSLVVSHVCSTPAWNKMAGNSVAKVVVPRVLLACNAGEEGYRKLGTKMGQYHRMLMAHMTTGVAGAIPPQSIAVVEGANCIGIFDAYQNNRFPPLHINAHTHAMELGLLHALDVALGMGDRLQNPNPNNVTVNPSTGQVVIIDLDICLPPYGLGKDIEDLCKFSITDEAYKKQRGNETPFKCSQVWTACPPRAPFQGDYRKNVTQALQRDLKLYADAFSEEVKAKIMTMSAGLMYPMWLLQFEKNTFMTAAKMALKEIKKGLQDGRFDLNVEDATFSTRRLKERALQWSGL